MYPVNVSAYGECQQGKHLIEAGRRALCVSPLRGRGPSVRGCGGRSLDAG